MRKINVNKNELHFAAYLKSLGIKLVDFQNGVFTFETDRSEVELRILHSNSEALRVDRELFTLKGFFK
jgi:hypothetical protein